MLNKSIHLYSHQIVSPDDIRYLHSMLRTDAAFRLKLSGILPLEIKVLKVAGRLLLQRALKNWGYDRDDELLHSAYGKPYIQDAPAFNLSYTEGLVVLAITDLDTIGVDIELVKEIDYKSMLKVLHPNEQKLVIESEEPLHDFYRIWTRKEAVLKAVGTGLVNELEQLDCSRQYPDDRYTTISWRTIHNFEKKYKVCLAAPDEMPHIDIITINQNEIFEV